LKLRIVPGLVNSSINKLRSSLKRCLFRANAIGFVLVIRTYYVGFDLKLDVNLFNDFELLTASNPLVLLNLIYNGALL